MEEVSTLAGLGIPILAAFAVIVFILGLMWVVRNFIKVPPNKAAIIFGVGVKSKVSVGDEERQFGFKHAYRAVSKNFL